MKNSSKYFLPILALLTIVSGYVIIIKNIIPKFYDEITFLSSNLEYLTKRVKELESQIMINDNYTVILKDLFLDNYNEALDKIKDYEIGTAGSSLKCAIAAAAFLNCTEQNVLSKQEITDNTIKYLSCLSTQEYEQFIQNIEIVFDCADDIVGKSEFSEGLLESAGNPQKYDVYSFEKYDMYKQTILSLIK